MDESASRLRMELDSMPTEVDQLERQIMQLEIEQNALRKEKDAASKERLHKLEKTLADLKENSKQLKTQWQNEKAAINAVSIVNSQIEQAKIDLEKAQRSGDLNTAAQIQYGRLPELQKKLADTEKALHEQPAGKRLLKLEVTEEDIAEVVSSWTRIPVSRMLEGEAHPHGGAHSSARRQPGGSGQSCVERRPPRAQRIARPEPTGWIIYIFGPHWGRENGIGPCPGGIPVR